MIVLPLSLVCLAAFVACVGRASITFARTSSSMRRYVCYESPYPVSSNASYSLLFMAIFLVESTTPPRSVTAFPIMFLSTKPRYWSRCRLACILRYAVASAAAILCSLLVQDLWD